MRKILLDMKHVSTPEEVQAYLAESFGFPEYYGMNLDALFDELSVMDQDTCVGFYEDSCPREINLYLEKVKHVLQDAEEENPHLAVIWA
ncbi:MAG: barstar family protein [Lachnospiraceae bacterium]|nr:barstar family protein [Lachnospiraceae bacterium]